jgi:hypothetical protein
MPTVRPVPIWSVLDRGAQTPQGQPADTDDVMTNV